MSRRRRSGSRKTLSLMIAVLIVVAAGAWHAWRQYRAEQGLAPAPPPPAASSARPAERGPATSQASPGAGGLRTYSDHFSGIETSQVSVFRRNCGELFGIPQKTATDFGRTYYVDHGGYVMEYSAARRIPLWVAHFLTSEQVTTVPEGYKRPRWRSDEKIPMEDRALDADYKAGVGDGERYDRGHMAPNADFGTKEGRDATFELSNTVPQVSQNNQGIWERFESSVREWVHQRGKGYVITGSIVELKREPAMAKPVAPKLLNGRVTVPTHLYKIVLAPKDEQAEGWESIAVLVENAKIDQGDDRSFDNEIEQAIVSIDAIEARAKLNFLPNLGEDTPEEAMLEDESAKPARLWAR